MVRWFPKPASNLAITVVFAGAFRAVAFLATAGLETALGAGAGALVPFVTAFLATRFVGAALVAGVAFFAETALGAVFFTASETGFFTAAFFVVALGMFIFRLSLKLLFKQKANGAQAGLAPRLNPKSLPIWRDAAAFRVPW